jgi:hypothetical protein
MTLFASWENTVVWCGLFLWAWAMTEYRKYKASDLG